LPSGKIKSCDKIGGLDSCHWSFLILIMRASLSLLVCHKAKAQKEASFLWSVIHKAFAVNEWHGNISTEFDKSCIHYGSHLVELVEHKFYICSTDPFAQHGWCHTANILWQLFAKKNNLSPQKVLFLCCNVCLINLCAKHLNNSVVYGYT
jgi:hypothetical protein